MRTEKDTFGQREIPREALYGIHALRARENFPGTTPFNLHWYSATGTVKQACYLTAIDFFRLAGPLLKPDSANPETNPMLMGDFQIFRESSAGGRETILNALVSAAGEVAEGDHFDHFIVPALQGGAGTSINMNINEIITNRALISLHHEPGDYPAIDPIEHANIFQSTNDVIPTALRVASMRLLQRLETSVNELRRTVESLENRHRSDLRIGYTQMQEAVPSSFGKLFSTYSEALSRDWWRISKGFERLKPVNLGGGAIGTGLAIPRYFIMNVTARLQQLTGLPIARSENMADTTSNLDPFVEVHAILKAHAVNLEKMVNDLRLLASDLVTPPPSHSLTPTPPHSHTPPPPHLIKLPPRQAGSSIMPGKVNPVIPEYVISAAHQIYAHDQLISSLCAQGCLELNAYLPQIGHAFLNSLEMLIGCNQTLLANLFSGMVVNPAVGLDALYRSPAIATALLPVIGYHKAGQLAAKIKETGGTIFEANEALKLVEQERLLELLRPENLLRLGYSVKEQQA